MGESSVDVKVYFPYQLEAAPLLGIFRNLIFFRTSNRYKLFIPDDFNSFTEYDFETLLEKVTSNSMEANYAVELSDNSSNLRLNVGSYNRITLHVVNPPYFATMINKVFDQVSEFGGIVVV